MTTSNEITLKHINDYFNLTAHLEPLNVAPTATGGAGINNEHQFRPPQPSIPMWKRSGTDYVKKYRDKEKEAQITGSHVSISTLSTGSLDTLLDVDDASTIAGAMPSIDELDSEVTQNIYSTYFNVPNRSYDQDLTITKYREEILQQLNISPVVIIQGPTGCGKTTQVPQYILDYHQSKGSYCNIIVTQPRKIAAISIARRVCQERKWQLGTIVGYQVAMDPKTSSDTRLCYVTTGVLLEKIVNAKRMDMYTHVILDEVHERNQDIDFALLLVKKFLNTNSQKVKVILMSATFDSTEFSEYFSLSSRGDPAPIVEIYGKSKDVTEHYIDELSTLLKKMPQFEISNPYIDPCLYDGVINLMCIFDRIEKAEQNIDQKSAKYAPKRGAVLIFLPGYEEISIMTDKLKNKSFDKNFWIIPLHSSITVEEQTKVFREAASDQRKVIISTNIAESSITVPDVKYVIDFCLTKNLVTDPASNYTCLQLEWASKANCIQRKGRAGRVDIGKVYRLVKRTFYDSLPDYGVPEIERCPLTKVILQLKKLNLCEPEEMLAFALNPPDLGEINNAILQLKEALALTSRGNGPRDGDLTFIGRVMASLPLDIKFSKLIIFGYVFHCLEECIIIAASLSLQTFFARPFQMVLEAYRSRLAWADGTFSDCLSHLYAFKMWKKLTVQAQFLKPGGRGEGHWAEKHFIQLRRIKEVELLVKEIKNRLEKLQIFVDQRHRYHEDEESNTLILKMVIAGAFFPYYFVQEELDELKINREINENDPHSTVLVAGLPKHGILYASALKDMFSYCSGSENIDIEFEGTKSYIRFQRNETETAPVLKSVYLACKMRKLRIPIELSVFSEEEADRKYRQLMATKREGPDTKLASNRITVKFGKGSEIRRVPLPPPNRSIERIFITFVNDCGHFWARKTTPDINSLYRFLETTINTERGRNLLPLGRPPHINNLYLAPYFEGQGAPMYYRAQVTDILGIRAKVFFVDYGNIEMIDISKLREIDESTPDVRETPALAFECRLSEIKPSSIKSPTGDWSKDANDWFKKNVSGIELRANIYSVVQDTVRVELLKLNQDRAILSINKELIRLDFAEPAEESLLSKQNNEIRFNAHDETASFDNASRDVEVFWKEAAECTKTTNKISLHGPYNPLEVSYSGLSYLDRSKRVKVERDSVNSVSFNAEPQDSYTSMLVAAHLGVTSDSLELVARNTTLMPKLRGLPSLVCLLFAPHAEIRTDKANKAYTGALCGLGCDDRGVAIYADHDIEIAFDIHLNMEDITEINSIRMGFNILLRNESETLAYPSNSVAILHEQTRKTIMSLLQKKREPKEPEYFRKPNQWNQMTGTQLDPEAEDDADCPHVFPLHRPTSIALFNDASDRKAMKKHLNDLYRIAEEPPSRNLRVIRCQICSLDITSTRDLVCHLDTEKHRRKEEAFRQGRN